MKNNRIVTITLLVGLSINAQSYTFDYNLKVIKQK